MTSPSARPSLRLYTTSPQPVGLGRLDADLDPMHEIGAAGADVGAEDVRAVALVVHAAGDLACGIGDRARVTEDVHGHSSDRRQEYLQVATCYQLGEHAARLLEEAAAQVALRDAEALRDSRQIPDRLDRGLRYPRIAVLGEHVAVR